MRPMVNKAGSAKGASSGCSLVCEQAKSRRRARTEMRCASRRPLFTIGLASEAALQGSGRFVTKRADDRS